jgi:ATP-binding cassette subfamily C protein CydC
VLAGHAASAAHRVLEAADAPVPVPDPTHPSAAPSGCDLRFEGVHFRWQPERPEVFDGLTLEVPQGTRVALLGPSGVGKSTLAALALKVVAPQQGRVLLGGVDIASLAAADVRARFGWLAQSTHLFDDTIRANLALARPDADEAALWAALDAAQVGDAVRALPDRLDAWLGEGGARFSGGEGRRLALARALLSPAPMLILDEPCAGLDAETERAFFATLNNVAVGRSVILIAHRLTGVERLDRIWRLSGGRAVAAAA